MLKLNPEWIKCKLIYFYGNFSIVDIPVIKEHEQKKFCLLVQIMEMQDILRVNPRIRQIFLNFVLSHDFYVLDLSLLLDHTVQNMDHKLVPTQGNDMILQYGLWILYTYLVQNDLNKNLNPKIVFNYLSLNSKLGQWTKF